jgi:aryl-alcohol dehydrogenase-like predicted oxidoreductase
VRRALEVQVDGEPLFTSFQCTWNLLETSVGPALAEAHAAGAHVIVKEPVANGRLAPTADADPRAARIARERGVPLDRLAVAAALAQPWADRVLSGAVDPAQVASNAAATEIAAPTDLDDLAEDPRAYWTARSTRSWA